MFGRIGGLVRSPGILVLCLAISGGAEAAMLAFEEHPVPRPGLVELDLPTPEDIPAQTKLESELVAGRYEESRATAEEVLAVLRARFGDGSQETVPALVNLATVLHEAGETQAAIGHYERAIRLIESRRNLRDLRLARPLYGLGLALHQAGRPREAATVLARAVFVRRANLGLHSLEQLEYYDALMASLIAAGRDEDAANRQEARLAIVEMATGSGSPELLAALEDAGAWMARLGRFQKEREIHQRRLDLIREEGGATDPRLVPVLRDIAQTYVSALEPDVRGVYILRQAIDIQEEQPGVSPASRAETLTELGDYYFLFRVPRRAYRYYERARRLLVEQRDVETLEAMYGRPRLLFAPQPDVGDLPPGAASLAEASVRLTVTARGEAEDVEILRIRPRRAEKAHEQVMRAMRNARFRPRITRDGPAETTRVRFRFRFRFPGGQV